MTWSELLVPDRLGPGIVRVGEESCVRDVNVRTFRECIIVLARAIFGRSWHSCVRLHGHFAVTTSCVGALRCQHCRFDIGPFVALDC
jgi:hypothetical protein